jgi:ribonucleotide monophosphatase NagD (HAD superfamily)
VGDGPATDALGAQEAGLDCLFIAGGLAARETRTPPGGQPDPEALATYLAAERLGPRYAIGYLR